ncbi:MAG: eukaryotic-like serine/threonine-protein kinase [Frankiales bacterium]|nr:eukaryotic-like serine/threonine-protein kinase [Frankiales bacterium]
MANFGPYDVLETVAIGSTGTVYRALQRDLNRTVAIKQLSPALLAVPGVIERFRSEAQMLAALDDPHVVAVYDYVEDDSGAWIAEEWVTGLSLRALLAQHGQLAPEQSVGVIRGGLLGLAHAHDRGLVHRDVAPGNLLLDNAGTSKLVDFGIASPIGSTGGCGTPAFVSPEVARGDAVTPASDVYSSAAVLYTLLSGHPPFDAPDAVTMLARHINDTPPRLRGSGTHLAGLLARAMDKDPAARPPDARAFLGELEEAAKRRFGAAWLSNASVVGVVTVAMGGGGMGAAAMGVAGAGAGAGGTTAAASSGSETVLITTGATDTGAAATGPAATTSLGAQPVPHPAGDSGAPSGSPPSRARSLRHLRPRSVLLIAGATVAVVGAVAVGAIALTGGSSGSSPEAKASASAAAAAVNLASKRAELLPDGRYTYTELRTATNSPRERVGGRFIGPGLLTMTCHGLICTGTLKLDAGVTFTMTYNGTTLTEALDLPLTRPNEDDAGNKLPGVNTQRQITRGSMTGNGTSFSGSTHTTLRLVSITGPKKPTNLGPWFADSTVTLTRITGSVAPSATPTSGGTGLDIQAPRS